MCWSRDIFHIAMTTFELLPYQACTETGPKLPFLLALGEEGGREGGEGGEGGRRLQIFLQ